MRSTRAAVIAGFLAFCWGCSTAQMSNWTVPIESACSSLAATVPLELETLQSIVGPNFDPATFANKNAGRLRVTVLSCPRPGGSGRNRASADFALVTVPLAKENASVNIAGMNVDDWASLALYVGPGSGRLSRFLSDSSFAVIDGNSSMSRQRFNDGERITASITFEDGALNISATFSCQAAPFRQTRVSVGTGSDKLSLLFGEISGSHCSSSEVSLVITGDTPFSDLDLTEDGATASMATGVNWNYRMLRNARF